MYPIRQQNNFTVIMTTFAMLYPWDYAVILDLITKLTKISQHIFIN